MTVHAGQHDPFTIKSGAALNNGNGKRGNGNGKDNGGGNGINGGNKILITSTTTSGLSRGLLTYLQSIGGDIFWSGDTFTDQMLKGVNGGVDMAGHSWASVRYVLNVVTFSYTTAFYDWSKWEYLLDWCALHGYNFPLAPGGQE